MIKCINCKRPMIKGQKVTEYICVIWDQIDGESEYEEREGHRYKCDYCGIKYNSLIKKWRFPRNNKKLAKKQCELLKKKVLSND